MATLIQKLFSPAYDTAEIDSYRSFNGICAFRELSQEPSIDGKMTRVLLLAHRDWSTGELYLEAKKEQELSIFDYIEQFFFGSKSLLNVQKVFSRVLEEGSHSPHSPDLVSSLAETRAYLNAKIIKTYPENLAAQIANVALTIFPQRPIACENLERLRTLNAPVKSSRLPKHGNYCFFNAAIKALWATPQVRAVIEEQRRFFSERPGQERIVNLLDRTLHLFDAISATEGFPKETNIAELVEELVSHFGFRNILKTGNQEDSGEFIDRFLQCILPDFTMNYFPVPTELPPGITASLDRFKCNLPIAPRLVPVQIARNIDGKSRSKSLVEIPTGLTLAPFVRTDDSLHSHLLRSVVVHSGSWSTSGHYYTYVPNYATLNEFGVCTQWTKHDDASVTPVRYYEIKEDIERNAYIALYEAAGVVF